MADDTGSRLSNATVKPANAALDAAFAFEAPVMNNECHPPILSPCTGICRLRSDGYCVGCLRSADEIARWISMSPAERRRLLEDVLPGRGPSRA